MAEKIKRREAREAVFGLLFETEFRSDENNDVILSTSSEEREIPDDEYIKNVYLGACEKMTELDAMLAKHSMGWRTERMSRVSRAILRLAVYEMMFIDDIPMNVSMNEAIELTKKYDDERAKAFVNGILNSVKNELEASK